MEEKGVEQKVLFWALLGPLIVLITLFTGLIKAPSQGIYLPAAAIIGICICQQWKLRGLAISLSLLFLCIGWLYMELPVHQRFWHVGLGMSFALALVVSALAFEEVESIIHQILVESNSRLQNLLRLDEKLKTLQDHLQCEEANFEVERKLSTQELQELKSQLIAQDESLEIARQEMRSHATERQRLLEDGLNERQKNVELMTKVELLQQQVRNPEESKRELQELEQKVALLEQVKNKLQFSLSDYEKGKQEASENLKLERSVSSNLKSELSDCKQQIEALKVAAVQAQQATDSVEVSLSPEELTRELARMNGLYKQLRSQFEEKDKVLHQTRKELFDKEGEVHALKRQSEEKECTGFSSKERELTKELSRIMQENKQVHEEVGALTELVDSLMQEKK